MDGLDQVSDDRGCFDVPEIEMSPSGHMAVRNRYYAGSEVIDRWTRLARTIEGEVIPRLLMAHRIDTQPSRPPLEPATLDKTTVERLAAIVLAHDDDTAGRLIQSLLAGGVPLESIYLDLMAPTARLLGEQWIADDVSFADVTLALCRLQRIMRTLAHTTSGMPHRDDSRGNRVLLASVPGEQHSFGVLMLEEFFRLDGWEVDCLHGASRDALLKSVRQAEFTAIGLSASADKNLTELRSLIADIRKAARSPRVVVMVGGRCFNDNPDYAEAVGADFTAVDGRHAISHIHFRLSNETNTG